MLGAIIGDIVGSVYEFSNIKTKDFELFKPDCRFTDDTIMSCAVAEAIMNGGSESNFIRSKKYGRMYPHAGYGGRFRVWLRSMDTEPYNSFGNGAAMRVSPCAWVMDCGFCARTGIWPSRDLARLSDSITHNHPEGIKGALAVCDAIFMARFYSDECKRRMKEHIENEYGYDLSMSLEKIRKDYEFDETCQGSVPQAISAFLESTDFENAIRNAISIGGDSDTIVAITGSIAEAAYGIPKEMKEKALSYLDEPLKDVLRRWKKYMRGDEIWMK